MIRGGANRPRDWTSEPEKLSDANDSWVKPPKIVPDSLLPPSRGMKLMRTPPVADCASTLETSMANSAMPVAFGTAPPPQPPPIIVLSATPLTIMRWSDCRLPLNSSDATSCTTEPPTSGTLAPPRLTPGINTPVVNGFRALGMAASTSWSITACRVVLCTSTIGDSPLTVMVSSSEPTRMSALTVKTAVPVSSTPSRLNVEKPESVKVTV